MDAKQPTLNIFGASSCWGARDHDCDGGPPALYALGLPRHIEEKGYACQLHHLASPQTSDSDPHKLDHIAEFCLALGEGVADSVAAKEKFMVIGGDHSCAIGTWSGAAKALATGDLGLIWIDAHMDSHTTQTSHSGAVHGMPLAALLGEGDRRLTSILGERAKLKPCNVCLIGVRSFEEEEAALLAKLGVRIYDHHEVKARGIAEVLAEAHARVKQHSSGYGISVDLDAIDPQDAPGVGSPEPDGLSGKALCAELARYKHDADLLGIEVVELNPVRDKLGLTSALAMRILLSVVE